MKIPFSREGFPYVGGLVGLAVLAYFINLWLGTLILGLALAVLWVFRDPERVETASVPDETETISAETELLAPADGRVISIVEFREEEFIKAQAVKICIRTSVFDVHVTRVPISGQVTFQQYYPGKLWAGSNDRLHDGREYTATGIEWGFGRVLLRQVRRFFIGKTVVRMATGDTVSRGMRSGIGHFGAVTEIIVPLNALEILVKPGDRVSGGQSVIGRLASR